MAAYYSSSAFETVTGDVLITDAGVSTIQPTSVENSMLAGSIANSKLSNSSVNYGGITLSLGGSDTTPAFNLTDATSLPIVAGTTGTLSVARGGTGATTLNNLITLGTHTTGNYVATLTGGTGITSTGATSGETIAHSISVDASQTQITGLGTITTGIWNSTFGATANTLISGSWQGSIDISTDTNLVAGTNITLSGDTLNVDDAFLINNGDDTTSGTITAGGFTTTGTLDISGGTLTLANNQISGDKVEGGTIAATTISALTTAGITATSNIDIGAYELRAQTFESDVVTGTAPLTVASTTKVTNLNADLLDGQTGTYYTDFTNQVIDDDEIPIAKLAQDAVTITAGDGLKTGGSVTLGSSVTLNIDTSDFAGTGLEDDGSENLRLTTQGAGLVGGNGSLLSVNSGSMLPYYSSSIFGTVSGDVTITDAGAVSIGATKVTGAMLNDDVISGQGEMTGDVADTDELMVSDAGTVKRADFSIVRDAVFGDVSGDILIADGGGATIQANSVALTTDTTGNYMVDLAEGTGIDISHTPAEGSTGTITLDLTEVGVDGAANQLITDDGDGTVSSEGNLKFDGTTLTIADSGGAGSTSYTSGFVGSGWRIDQGIQEAGKTSATFDNLTIRGTMSVYELLINQVRATNGNLFVSSTGKVSGSVTHNGGVSYTLNFDTGDNSGHGFAANDVIRMQRFDNAGTGGSVILSDLTVASVASTGSLTANLRTGTIAPQEGFEYVRLGNTSTAGRQGGIYLTADDANAPFIDVFDNITSHADWNANTGSANTNAGGPGTKVRIGKLDGITSARFGSLPASSYGLWASGSVYLEGGINASFGKIGNWTIGTALYNTKTTLAVDTGNNGIYIGTDGIAAQVSNVNTFSLTTSTGAIFANTGVIGGWTLGTNLTSTDMRLNPGDSIELGDATTYALGNGIWLGNNGTARFGNASAARLQWNLTNVEIYNSGNTKLVSLGASNIIAGWEISGSRINKGNISLNATTASLRVSDDTRERVRVGDLDGVGGYSAANAKRYGVIGFDGTGTLAADVMFELSNARNIIAGWTIAPTAISKGNVSLAAVSDTSAYLGIGTTSYGAPGIFIGQTAGSTYKISASGSAGGMFWDNTKLSVKGANATTVFETTVTGATIGGWTIDADAIFRGTEVADNTYTAAGGITLGAGFIGANQFKIAADGTATFKGNLSAPTGTIGGWTIDANAIFIGTEVANDTYTTAGGITLGTGFIGSNQFKIAADGTATFKGNLSAPTGTIGGWTITDTTLSGGVVTLDSAGSIEVGGLSDATTVATTNSGFFADSSGNVLIKGNTSGNDYFKVSAAGGIDIKTQVFDLDASTIIVDSATNSGKIALGATPPTSFGSGTGFYADGTGDFYVGKDKGVGISFDSSEGNLIMSSSTFLLGVSGSANGAYISGSGGNLEISSSNFFLAPTGDVTTKGTITATAGQIGDWVITGSNMESNTDYFRGIKLQPLDRIVGYGAENHQNTTTPGAFSFGVAPVGGGMGAV